MTDPGDSALTRARRRGAAAGVLALCLLAVTPFVGAVAGWELLYGRDLPRQFYPRCDVIGRALAEGEVPRWNPWCGHGAPWFGPRAGGVLYPGHVLFAALRLGPAMGAFVALHTALAAVGAWRLARLDARSSTGAWLGALAYGLGGFVTSMHWALPYLVSSAWLPWGLLGARQVARAEVRGVAWIGAAVAMCLLAAEPQGALIVSALAGGSALLHGAGRRARAVALAGLAVLLGAAGGGLTIVSVLDELPRLDRGAGSWSELRFPLHLAQLVDALVPGVHGHWAQHTSGFWGVRAWGGDMPWCGLGVGALGVVAAALSSHRWRSAAWIEGAGWVALGVLLALVDAGAWLQLRYPSKWLVITALGLSRLVGLGAERLLRPVPGVGDRVVAAVERLERPGALARLARFVGQGVADLQRSADVVLLAFGAGLTLLALVLALGGAAVEARIASVSPSYVSASEARAVTAYAVGRAGVAALVAAGACLVAARRPGRTGRALLVGALALDLVTAARAGVLTIPANLPVHAEPATLAALRAGAGGPAGAPPRYEPKNVYYRHSYPSLGLEARELHERDAMRTNIGYRWGVRTVIAFESVEPAGLAALQRDPRWTSLPLLRRYALIDGDVLLADERDAPNYGLPADRVPTLARVAPHDGMVAVKNPLCPPWAYLVGAAVTAPDIEVARSQLLDPRHGPDVRVVLGPEGAEGVADTSGPGRLEGERVTLRRFSAERVELTVDAPHDAWLVVRDAWSPDWVATIDGAPTLVVRADLLYRAVRVPAGAHEVVFTYAPRWWAPAVALTVGGWIGLLAFVWIGRRR